ncbi:putative helicase MOV-10 isoform X2 [Dendrobates tinctorius]|uniref:putative helicase MOV-10 isoform X2 n=1 Tax=Dendrobates tinctorius TaxID=92724 RepID=UPI003CC9E54B
MSTMYYSALPPRQWSPVYTADSRGYDVFPNFSGALYGLKTAGKLSRKGDSIHLSQVVTKRSILADGYAAIRQNQEPLILPPAQAGNNYTRSQARRIIQWMKKSRAEFIQNKNEIEIKSYHDLTDGRIRFPLPLMEAKTVSIRIENKSKESVKFLQYKLLRRMRIFSLQDDENVSSNNSKILNPGDVYEVSVNASTAYYGYFPATIVFEFTKGNPESQFLIGRFLSAVASSRLAEDLAPTSRYIPYQRNLVKTSIINEEDGIPPDRSDSVPSVVTEFFFLGVCAFCSYAVICLYFTAFHFLFHLHHTLAIYHLKCKIFL